MEDSSVAEIFLAAGPGKAPPWEVATTEQGFCGRVGDTAAPCPSAQLFQKLRGATMQRLVSAAD